MACHSVLLLDDGAALAFGVRSRGLCDVPALPSGRRYVGWGQPRLLGPWSPQLHRRFPGDARALVREVLLAELRARTKGKAFPTRHCLLEKVLPSLVPAAVVPLV
mmetsp:Transcript_101946/g.318610  ORF Transcript_101946/g.318610 Transcript_101946/m.318610 type:complete len:105 (-) Transcript_101946:104-418(-)